MALDTVAKVTVSIGPTATIDRTSDETAKSSFAAITEWTAIKNIENVGEMQGDKPVAVGRYVDQDYVRKLSAGGRDPGNLEMVFGYDPEDAGQTALKAADLDNEAHALKVELPDAPDGGTPTTFYYMAIVGPVGISFGDGTEMIKLTATFNIDGAPIEVAAAAGGV